MNTPGLKDQLQRLHQLLLKERECARALAMDELMATVQQKEALLGCLEQVDAADAETRQLAEQIRAENRRNAYLFWSALQWIRESMQFFGRQSVPSGYGAAGATVNTANSGMILSGRV